MYYFEIPQKNFSPDIFSGVLKNQNRYTDEKGHY